MNENKEKKYTVKEFCEKYNVMNSEQNKIMFIEKIMNRDYVPYEIKIAICKKIIENSYYQKDEHGKILRLYSNSTVLYMLYCLNLINQYTFIKIDFSNCLDEFNLLNKNSLLDILSNNIPDREKTEFRMILDMVEKDILQNEYEIHSFISNNVNVFSEILGSFISTSIDRFCSVIENMDEKTLNKLINKFDLSKIIKK